MSDKKVIEGRLEIASVFPTGPFNPVIIFEGDIPSTTPLSQLLDGVWLKDFVGKHIRITVEEVD
jgi:hypothetical protein